MRVIFFLFSFFLIGCTTLSKDTQLVSDKADIAKLLVFRVSDAQASLVSEYIGESDKYFMKLWVNEYVVVEISSGKHKFQAKADASPSSELSIDLPINEMTCIESKPNPGVFPAAFAIPLYANTVPSFVLSKVECPSQETLAKMKLAKT